MSRAKLIWRLALLFACGLVLTACGGGGGHDGEQLHPSYQGVTTQVVLDGSNAESIVLGAYQGGFLNERMGGAMPLAAEGVDPSSQATLAEVLGRTARLAVGGSGARTVAVSEEEVVPGNCIEAPGQMVFSITAEDSGAFKGGMDFQSYCSDGLTLSGIVPFSGTVKETTNDIVLTMAMDLNELTSQETGGALFAADGSLSLKLSMNTDTGLFSGSMRMEMVLTDTLTQKTFYYRNYQLQITDGEDFDDTSIAGRYYDHDRGYVVISTETPCRTGWDDVYPVSGTLRFTGASGTWAELTFSGGGAYLIELHDGTQIEGTLGRPDLPSLRLAYLQYRTYESTAYPFGWVDVFPTSQDLFESISLTDADGFEVPMTISASTADYLVYDCLGAACQLAPSYRDQGFALNNLPNDLAAGSYTVELTAADGRTLSQTVDYAGAAVVPPVTSATMLAERIDASIDGSLLALSWQNPTSTAGWEKVTQLRVELHDSAFPGRRIWIKLPATAESIDLPTAILTQAGIDPASTTLLWRIQTRCDPDLSARGYSNYVPVPPPLPENPIRIAYLQYRTLEATAYPFAWVDIFPADLATIESAVVLDSGGNTVSATPTPYVADCLVYDCRGAACALAEPWRDQGFYMILPNELPAGDYTFQLTDTVGQVSGRTVSYSGPVTLPAIGSGTMQAQRPDAAALQLNWQNPTIAEGWKMVTGIRVEFNDDTVPGKRLWVNLPPTAETIDVPLELLSQAGLDPDSPSLQWRLQTRADPDLSARGYSNYISVN